MAKKCLAMLLCIAMVLSLVTLPTAFAEEGDLFSDNFESWGEVGTTIPSGGGTEWDANFGPVVVGTDPLNPDNKVAEYVASEGQQYPPLHKKVAMAVGTTTLFSGRVMLHPTANSVPNYYLQFRNSVDGSAGHWQTIFGINTDRITLMGGSDSYGKAVADKWISYAAYITPGLEGQVTKILIVLTSEDGLLDASGEPTNTITMEGEGVFDNIAVFDNNAGNMVHNSNVPYYAEDNSARIYLDDVRIYNTASLSTDATLSSLSYNGTPIGEFDPSKTTYNIRVEDDIDSVTVTAQATDTNAQIESISPETLTQFPGSVSVTVKSEAGTTQVYTIYFSKKLSGDAMVASIMSTKGNAGAIATITSDDGVITSGRILDELTQKYEIPVSCAGIVSSSFNGSSLAEWQEIESHGWIEVFNHSWTHPDRMSDSPSYADKECNTEEGLQRELVDSKEWFEQNFETDAISFAAPNNSMSTRGWEIMKEQGYYSARLGSRGFNNIPPEDGTKAGQWMNLYMQGIGDGANNTAMRNGWVDTAIKNGQWLVEMWHNVSENGTGGYQPISRAAAEEHIAYMVEKRDAGELWIAGIVEATKYLREYQVSSVSAAKTADGKVQAEVTYPSDALPSEIFDYPLTVKVEVPEEWGAVLITQNGSASTATTFVEGNVNYVYADIVPNQGVAVLEDAGASNLLSDIKLNGVSLSGFNPAQNTYEIEKQSSELPVEITAVPLNSKVDVQISQATVSEVPATVTITLSGADIDTNVYTLNFIYAKSTNNLLSGITVNGVSIGNFTADGTSYSVTTEGADTEATIVATAQDTKATVSYDPSDTITLPGTVTITVTAENGSEKKYTVAVRSRADDTEYLFDSYDSYTENEQITIGKWTGFNFSSGTDTYGVLAVKDPTDESNMVGKIFNTGASGQNQQMNKQLGATTTEPVIVSGRFMVPEGTTESGMDILVRGEGINLTTIANFKDGDIMVGNSRVADAKYAPDKWFNYVLVIKPGSGKYSVTGYFFGEGIMDASGAPAENGYLVVTKDSASNSLTDMSKMDCRILLRGNVAMSDTNVVYVDDVRIYSPGVFKLSMDNTEGVDTTDGIEVTANHDIAVDTITPENVIVKAANNDTVAVSDVEITGPKSFRVMFDTLPANGSYTLSLADAATDAAGQKLSAPLAFTVQNADYDEITALSIDTPDNLSQTYDNMQAVTFTVTTTPAENVYTRGIEWYVNDEKQETTGLAFTYTPADDGMSYNVYAKVAGTEIKTETRTITVTQHPIVPITALALDTPANINQTVGNVTPVTFTALTTPDDNVDVSTIEWYLNGEKQSTTGATFTFTPADETGSYSVYAKVADSDVISDTKTVSVTLRIPQDDVLYLDEDFESYEIGEGPATGGELQFTMVNNTVMQDPKDEQNKVGSFKAGSGMQYRHNLSWTGEDQTFYFTGDFLIPNFATAGYDISIRDSSVITLVSFGNTTRADGRVTIAGSQESGIYIQKNEWVHYTIKVTVDADTPTNSTIKLYLSGGVEGRDYYESAEKTINLTNAIDGYAMYRSSPTNEAELPLIDNMKVYTTTDLLLSMEETSGVAPDAPIVVTLNHDIAPSTLTAENVTLQTSGGEKVELASVTFDGRDPSRVTLTPASALAANTSYTVLFGENVKDVAGNSAANTVSFTTSGGSVTPPDPDVPSYKVQFSATGAGTISYSGPDGETDLAAGGERTLAQGSDVTVTAKASSGAKFLYWVRVDTGRIVSTEAAYSFTVGSAAQLSAVFGSTDGQKLAVFTNGRNGQVIQSGYTTGSVLVPDAPYVMGYTFTGWLRDGVPQKFNSGESIEVTGDAVYEAWYEQEATTYTITVGNGTGSGEYKFNDEVTAVANTAPSGEKFSHWTKDGAVVSYDATYTFFASGAATVTAVYVAESETVEREPVLVASVVPLADDGRLAFFSERDLPDEWEVIETGLLLSEQAEFDMETATIKAASTSTENKGQYTIRKAGVQSGETWYGRAYVVYRAGSEIEVMYSDVVSAAL